MFFSRWLCAQNRTKRSGRPHRFRPVLSVLEDRTVPSGFHFLSTPGPAASLLVVVPHSVQSGTPFNVEVEALDGSNRVASGYTGTVSLATADMSSATLPAAYTFVASDHGEHTFTVTLSATGSETIVASGTLPSSSAAATTTTPITGSATTTVLAAPTLAQIIVVTPEQAAVGVPVSVKVEALDASGHLLKNFTGTVNLLTSDAGATGLPTTYTFTAPNGGSHTFQVTFETPTTAALPTTVTATDGSATSTGSLVVYPATTVTHFGIESRSIFGASTGSPTPVTVVALNAANQPVTGYVGTVTLTSSDTAATAAATESGPYTSLGTSFTYQFQASEGGAHTFYVNFGTTGSQSLTATDSTTYSTNDISGTTQIQVSNRRFRGFWNWW